MNHLWLLSAIALTISTSAMCGVAKDDNKRVNRVAANSAVKLTEQKQVLKQAQKYASSIACASSLEGDVNDGRLLQHVHKIDINNGMQANYVVFWRGNDGCVGGNAADTSYLTLFNRQYVSKPFVRDYATADIIESLNDQGFAINAWGINEAEVRNNNTIVLHGKEFDDGDNPGFPSLDVEYQIKYDDKLKQWVILE